VEPGEGFMAELIWEGKYDANGRRVPPVRVALPFQTVETVNESAQERQRSLDLFGSGRDPEWRNRLIWGDKKYVLPALLSEFAGRIDLIYIDPPFATGADFSFHVDLEGEQFTKEPSVIEQKAYRDTWSGGLDSYLAWFSSLASHAHELLADTGSLYVHLDSGVAHAVKLLLDEVFGSENFRNEIAWRRANAHNDPKRYGRITDLILYYAKSEQVVWNPLHTPYREDYYKSHFSLDENGRHFRTTPLDAPRHGAGSPSLIYEWRGKLPAPSRTWAVRREKMEDYETAGRIRYTRAGTPTLLQYAEEMPGVPLQDMWTDIPPVNPQAIERVGYPTQKPVALLQRIIAASSNPGDLVMDCVGGSGTTAVACETSDRRWIVADLGRFAICTTRKRLLSIPSLKPFVVQNLGKYERQAWQSAEFGDDAEHRQRRYRNFILGLYHAQPIDGHVWIHAIKSGRMVHVGSVDAPVSPGDVSQIAQEVKRSTGTGDSGSPRSNGVDVLGWDFAFELNEVAKQQAALAGIDMRFVRIPREVLEKRAVDQGDIRFFELAALSVDIQTTNRSIALSLTNFVMSPDDIPEDVQRAVSNWAQWIDYWAVDWDNRDDTFHNQWQTFRTRQNQGLEKSVTHTYSEGGTYRVMVKVIDILGSDTTKTLTVQVA
jgi:adenine-specific DNA-methyltransferase